MNRSPGQATEHPPTPLGGGGEGGCGAQKGGKRGGGGGGVSGNIVQEMQNRFSIIVGDKKKLFVGIVRIHTSLYIKLKYTYFIFFSFDKPAD